MTNLAHLTTDETHRFFQETIMARSAHVTYTAADRYERRATKRQRPCQSRRAAITESIEAV